jgi:TonB-linked SusC/RagA family outer membrane protein
MLRKKTLLTVAARTLIMALPLLGARENGYAQTNPQTNQKADSTLLEGRIVDSATQKPIEGVTIFLKGASRQIITDNDGHFSVRTKAKFPIALSINFVGYNAIELIASKSPVNVQLGSKNLKLADFVVVGYGKQSKAEFTGSIAHINGDLIKDAPIQSFDQALAGKATGVSIGLPTGVLNTPPVIRIRGINSISLSSYPLIVVDGIPINTGNVSSNSNVVNNPLGDIDPQDIESIDILKDAASTSIYGSRAAAGVLLITTKKGKQGNVRTNFSSWVGVSRAVRLPKLLNAVEYSEIKNEAVNNSKILTGNANNNSVDSALFFPAYRADGSLVDTKWYDQVYHTGVSGNANIDVSGANKTTNYYFSANYSNQNGFLVGNNFKRKAIRFNVEHALTSWFKVRADGNYNNTFNRSYNTGSLPNNAQLLIGAGRLAIALPPNVTAYNDDGSLNLSSTGAIGMGNNKASLSLYNPAALFKYSRYTSEGDHFLGNIGATIKFLKHFEFLSTYSIDRLKLEDQTYLSPDIGSSAYSVGGSATNVSTLINNWDWANSLTYSNSWNRHHVSALAGTDEQQIKNSAWGAYATVASDDYFQYYQGGWTNLVSSGNSLGTVGFLSAFGRLNYDFDRKYFITVNFRRDGNSALAAGHKYGNFGGVSAGWTLSRENFYKNLGLSHVITNAKFSGSWGKVGNGNLTSNYAAMNLYGSSLYGSSSTWYLSQVGNSNLRWETSEQTNINADLEFWNNRAQLNLTWFNNNVNGLILSVPQSPSKGIPGNAILSNVGSMYNRGIEIGLSAKVIDKEGFSWNTTINYSHVKNKVTALAGGNADIIGYTHTSANSNNVTRVGYSISSLYGAKTAGVNPANGQRIFINAGGDKVQYSAAVASGASHWTYLDGTTAPAISASDYYLLANALPAWYGGFNNSFSFQNFDASLNFVYSGGNYVMNGTKATLRDQTAYNNYTDIYKRWTTPGQVTDIPRLVYNDIISNGTSFPVSSNVEKADFLRLQNVLLGYRFSKKLIKADWISSLRIYAQITNVFLLTKYSGTDPESSANGNSNTSIGVERNAVGQGRTITFGINTSF